MFQAYKNNLVEQNEIFRENKFTRWSINGETALPIFLALVVFPVAIHSLVKSEYRVKEERAGVAVVSRF